MDPHEHNVTRIIVIHFTSSHPVLKTDKMRTVSFVCAFVCIGGRGERSASTHLMVRSFQV